jgi:hypothetical protein
MLGGAHLWGHKKRSHHGYPGSNRMVGINHLISDFVANVAKSPSGDVIPNVTEYND